MDFRILGPLEAVAEGRVVQLSAAKPRALLAILLLHASRPVSCDRLIEDIWAGRPPATAAKLLQTYVSQLRKALGNDVIVTRPAGYEIVVEPGSVDLHRFERLVTEARGAEPTAAAHVLRDALALWRGPPLADFMYERWAQGEIGRLEELRLAALQDRIDADLALGRDGDLVGELERLVCEHPLAERLCGQLMLALYRSGRQAEALGAYRAARERLVETLGIEPGGALRRLERAILEHDPALDVTPAAPALVPRRTTPSLWPPTSFVGRKRELRELHNLLSGMDVRLLTLTGAAGSGKTRLAVEATASVCEEFPDGVVLVELAPISDPRLVAAAIAEALGLGEGTGQERVEALFAYLRPRQALLVLDNFEQVLAAAPLLSELLARAPALKLLVTSRAPVDLAEERIYPVPVLQLPDRAHLGDVGRLRRTEAVHLFIERARDARPDFELSEANSGVVVDLCRRLDGLPLALELAAARIRLLSPADILERLGRKLEPLRAQPGSGVPQRHRTLRAAIEWSYNLMRVEERELLTSLSVFVGGFTLDGAEAVASDLELDVVDGIESLLQNNLLRAERMRAGEPRFGMLETIRDYALERLEERGDGEAVRHRHATFFLAVAEEAEPGLLGPQQLRWLERLDAELANIRAALTSLAQSGEAETGLRMGTALWRYWQMRARGHGHGGHPVRPGGVYAEGRERLEQLLAIGSGSSAVRASAQAAIASIALVQGDHRAVRRLLEASLPVHRELGDDRQVAFSLAVLGHSALALGDADRALPFAEEGLAHARRSGDISIEAMLLHSVGVAHGWRGELEAAERAVAGSVRVARQTGNTASVGNWLRSLGSISLARGDFAQARVCFEESLAVGRGIGQPFWIAHALSSLALVAQKMHDHDAARRLLEESVAIERETGELLGLAANHELYAMIAVGEHRPARAARLYASARVLRESVGVDASAFGWPDPDPIVAGLRSALGEDAFARAWEDGRAMTLDESLDYALRGD